MTPMKKLHSSILINAPKEKVWQTVIGTDTYPLWTETISVGSNFEGSWEKGAKIKFTGPNETGGRDGMYSQVVENREYEYISIEHLGFIFNGVVDTGSPMVQAWKGATENYTFKTIGTATEFSLEQDVADEMYEEFSAFWLRALQSLKEVAETGASSSISVVSWVAAPIEKVWECYTNPQDIMSWAFASDDWEAPAAENDLRVGGRFKTTMAAKDKSASFDLTGTYTEVKPHELIAYTMDGADARTVRITFEQGEKSVKVTTRFVMETENSRELQRAGWQAISDNFKKYVEARK